MKTGKGIHLCAYLLYLVQCGHHIRVIKLTGYTEGARKVIRADNKTIYSIYRQNCLNVFHRFYMFHLNNNNALCFIPSSVAIKIRSIRLGTCKAHTTETLRWISYRSNRPLCILFCIDHRHNHSVSSCVHYPLDQIRFVLTHPHERAHTAQVDYLYELLRLMHGDGAVFHIYR